MSAGALAGRAAIVTGGARGIGAAICRALAAHGASVVVADNGAAIDGSGADPAVAPAFAAELGAGAAAFAGDVASPAAAQAMVDLARERFGGVDIVVNNAAILRDGFIFKGDAAAFDSVLRNNLSAPYYLLAAATPIMRDQAKAGRGDGRWGRVVNIVSTAGFYGNYGQAAYASAKAGLMGLTRVVALDMARSGVTCNAVAPFARTRVTDSIVPANDAQAAYKARALAVDAAPVATLVAWLCTAAAQGVTGQLLGVRGREVMAFAQARPAARAVLAPDAGLEALTRAVETELAPAFVDLATDLEAFNTDPAV